MSKVKVTVNENVKVVFYLYIFFKSGSINVKPRPKWATFHSKHIVKHFTNANASFLADRT